MLAEGIAILRETGRAYHYNTLAALVAERTGKKVPKSGPRHLYNAGYYGTEGCYLAAKGVVALRSSKVSAADAEAAVPTQENVRAAFAAQSQELAELKVQMAALLAAKEKEGK